MKILISVSLLVVAISASLVEKEYVKFQNFKVRYNKIYRTQVEETNHFNTFKENLRFIEQHNTLYEQGFVSYEQGVNQFTDLAREEFVALLTLSSSNKPYFNATKHINTGLAIPDFVDWRTKGQVTEVKDQGFCGSCWAFSITGSTEGAYARESGKLVSLSEQQLVDCTHDVNSGCFGGNLELTFPYVETYGLQSEGTYPYMGVGKACTYSAADVVTKISSFKIIEPGNEDDLLDAVANVGPVSVALDATGLSSYKSGIYDNPSCSSGTLNHGVLIVGYGIENGISYWIVKNSWAASFGEEGYFRIKRGCNQCGIATDTVYPSCN